MLSLTLITSTSAGASHKRDTAALARVLGDQSKR